MKLEVDVVEPEEINVTIKLIGTKKEIRLLVENVFGRECSIPEMLVSEGMGRKDANSISHSLNLLFVAMRHI